MSSLPFYSLHAAGRAPTVSVGEVELLHSVPQFPSGCGRPFGREQNFLEMNGWNSIWCIGSS